MPDKKTKCPLRYLLNTFGGKWKLPIICIISQEPQRFATIKRRLGDITSAMLSKSLKELEADELVKRTDFHEIVPHVEYSLTTKGKRVLPMLTTAAEWAVKEMGYENIQAYCAECNKYS